MQDLKEHTRLEEERKNVELKIEKIQKFESLALLASSIAHDFNNYLSGILGNLELSLGMLEDGSPLFRQLSETRQIAMQARDLIRSMLDFAGSSSMHTEVLSLQTLLEEMQPLIETSTQHKKIISYEIDKNPILVMGDKSQLTQSIFNIILNAVEAAPKEQGQVTIRCTRKTMNSDYLLENFHVGVELFAGTYALLSVSDNGPGIPKSMLRKIFDPFFSTKKSGRGIGLSTAMGIVKAHGGCIIVESGQGQGSEFSITLPLAEP